MNGTVHWVYQPARGTVQRDGSDLFDRSPLKSEARRFSEKNRSVSHPVKFEAPPCFLIGYLETICQQRITTFWASNVHCAFVIILQIFS